MTYDQMFSIKWDTKNDSAFSVGAISKLYWVQLIICHYCMLYHFLPPNYYVAPTSLIAFFICKKKNDNSINSLLNMAWTATFFLK